MNYRVTMLLLLALTTMGCTNLFYFPTRQEYYTPSEKAPLHPEDIHFNSLDGTKLHGWWFATPKKVEGTVIQFHGNAENLTSHFLSLAWVLNHGYNLFAFDYRGYGKSEGAPYPAGVHMDSLAALAMAKEKTPGSGKDIVVFGQSIGGAIALKALEEGKARERVRAVVIESSFLSYKKMAVSALSDVWFTWPIQWLGYLLVSDSYSPKKNLRRLEGLHILVLHGSGDTIVPIRHGRDLFKKLPEPKYFWEFNSDEHAHLMNSDRGEHREAMLEFFRSGHCPGLESGF